MDYRGLVFCFIRLAISLIIGIGILGLIHYMFKRASRR